MLDPLDSAIARGMKQLIGRVAADDTSLLVLYGPYVDPNWVLTVLGD